MKSPRVWALILLGFGIVLGTVLDRVPPRPAIMLGGYRVLAADFHTHSSTWSDGATTPWGLVMEAQRRGLDAIAITGHNQTLDAKVGRWFAERTGPLTVLVGEEIPTPDHHVIAVGITRTIDWRLGILDQIDEIHRQGGVAIAAHPEAAFWPGFAPAVQHLDGAEVCHPLVFLDASAQDTFASFAATGPMAAIGSSDFHGAGRMGMCRTFVFARDESEAAVLEAIRARRTVVYGLAGRVYGDPGLIRLAEADGRLADAARPGYAVGGLDRAGQVLGVLGLLLIAFTGRRGEDRSRSTTSIP